MIEDIETYRLHVSRCRPRQKPLPWPTATELARARETDLIGPVVVRPLPGTRPPDYEILIGLKNWLLAQRLGASNVPVRVREVDDETARRWVEADAADPARDAILEACAIRQQVAQGSSVAAAGRAFGLSRTDASHRLRLLRLSPEIRDRISRGELRPGLARALVDLHPDRQLAMAARIRDEGLSARKVEALVKAWKTDAPVQPPAAAPGRDPDRERLEQTLSAQLGTPVAVRYEASGRGQLVVDFADLDILEGVLDRLGYHTY